jgi:hypothetical protein
MRARNLRLSRRRLLTGALAFTAADLLLRRARPAVAEPGDERHLVWLWQFSSDGAPDVVGARLRDAGLGIVLKTHDGVEWMSRYDESPYAVSGPEQVALLAAYYEAAAVPFHAWAAVQGVEPQTEARMAAEVLTAGARSLYLDVDVEFDSWRGTRAAATAFARELRRLAPDGRVVLTVDSRPWQLRRLPLAELAGHGSAIALKLFSRIYDTADDRAGFLEEGFSVPREGVLPELLLAAAEPYVGSLGLPVGYVGQADLAPAETARFLDLAVKAGSPAVSLWRAGLATDATFSLLRDRPPVPPPPEPVATPAGPAAPRERRTYVVRPGDTLTAIAAAHGVSIGAIAGANNLQDPDLIRAGQELVIP